MTQSAARELVLILILMEDTLRANGMWELKTILAVLILILMEDTLRAHFRRVNGIHVKVLILILMEDTLRVINEDAIVAETTRS